MRLVHLLLLNALTFGFPLAVVAQETECSFAVTHVTVIDCTGAPSKPDMTVIVTGDRIAAVGKAADINVPKGAIIIDASQKFMIPGLWDMHIHVRPFEAPLFIANGVTGVRIMFGRPLDIEASHLVRERATFIPERNVACAPLADEFFDMRMDRDVIRVTTEAEARKAVSSAKKIGFDSVKISSLLRRDLYISVADEAKRVRIPFVTHFGLAVSNRSRVAIGALSQFGYS